MPSVVNKLRSINVDLMDNLDSVDFFLDIVDNLYLVDLQLIH